MPEIETGWLYEAGIGENRAIFVDRGGLTKVRIERPVGGLKSGAVVDAVFKQQWVAGKSGIVLTENGQEALLQPLPKDLTEGGAIRIEIVREAELELQGGFKRAKARPAMSDAELEDGPSLLDQISDDDHPAKTVDPNENNHFAELGWHEAMEQAQSGHIDFDGGLLIISLTPAMTVIDVDGPLRLVELAKRAAREIALALVRFDIGGNIGIDFPTIEAKSDRAAICAVFDDHMTGDCERTAINGFGFMQVVRKKVRPSVLEVVRAQKVKTATLQFLRQAEREHGTGEMVLNVHPALDSQFQKHPGWLEELAKRTGRQVSVHSDGKIPINAGHISSN